jgi:hypothetical protein
MVHTSADPLFERLFTAAGKLPIIDTHQHLAPETPVETDLCRLMLDDNYLLTDLTSAGLDPARREHLADPAAPLDERWWELLPFWQKARWTSYGQAVWLTLRDLYGAVSLDVSDALAVSARVTQDFRTPGLFERVLAKRCNIAGVLTQNPGTFQTPPRFWLVARPLDRADFRPGGAFEEDAARLGITVRSAADLAPAMDAILGGWLDAGAVGFKIAALAWNEPTESELQEAFARRAAPADAHASANPLVRLYVSRIARAAAQAGIPVAVHTGAPWTNWLDFRVWEPTALIPLLSAFRDTRFDLYHAGIPYVTQIGVLAKAYPNVWLNLCWAHLISTELSLRALREWLDLVPWNKILGFGGDYGNRTVVNTYGHLLLARRNLVTALVGAMRDGRMVGADADRLLQAWLVDNPRELYRLPTGS